MRREVDWRTAFDRLSEAMDDDLGMFLVACDGEGRPNPMTVSWGQIGFVWGRPIFTVFVRESRYTHACLMGADSFTINVPGENPLSDELTLCGTKSGRDMDKLAACSLDTLPSARVSAPYLPASSLHFECSIVARKQLELEDVVSTDVLQKHYAGGDPHLVVFGEIVGVFREE